jgi:His-Xaa-Ser system protein HxsD
MGFRQSPAQLPGAEEISMNQPQIERLDAQTATLTLSLDSGLYPRDVLFAAAYVFLDRAYVLLDRDGTRFLVHLRGKQAFDEAALRALAGEFENELLAQALRRRVAKANQKIIEDITTLAIAGAAGGTMHADAPNGHESSEGPDDSTDFLDDPLGIAKPWEPEKDGA